MRNSDSGWSCAGLAASLLSSLEVKFGLAGVGSRYKQTTDDSSSHIKVARHCSYKIGYCNHKSNKEQGEQSKSHSLLSYNCTDIINRTNANLTGNTLTPPQQKVNNCGFQ